jgi:hypothetical protein
MKGARVLWLLAVVSAVAWAGGKVITPGDSDMPEPGKGDPPCMKACALKAQACIQKCPLPDHETPADKNDTEPDDKPKKPPRKPGKADDCAGACAKEMAPCYKRCK